MNESNNGELMKNGYRCLELWYFRFSAKLVNCRSCVARNLRNTLLVSLPLLYSHSLYILPYLFLHLLPNDKNSILSLHSHIHSHSHSSPKQLFIFIKVSLTFIPNSSSALLLLSFTNSFTLVFQEMFTVLLFTHLLYPHFFGSIFLYALFPFVTSFISSFHHALPFLLSLLLLLLKSLHLWAPLINTSLTLDSSPIVVQDSLSRIPSSHTLLSLFPILPFTS